MKERGKNSTLLLHSKPGSPMRSRIFWTLLVAGLLPFATVLGWRLYRAGRPATEVLLGDGRRVQVYLVGADRKQYSPFLTPGERLATLLPEKLRARLPQGLVPALPQSLMAGTNALGVWLLFENRRSSAPFSHEFSVRIGHPPLYGGTGGSGLMGTNRDGWHYEGYAFRSWPRTARDWEILVYSGDGDDTLLGSARLRNPFPLSKVAPWRGGSLPIHVEQDGTEFILKGLWVGKPSEQGRRNDAGEAGESPTRLTFDIREAGQRSTNWVSYHVQHIEDAHGNRSDGNHWTHGWDGDESYIQFARWPLPAGTGAWKLRVEFIRQGGFGPEHLWEWNGLPVGTVRRRDEQDAIGLEVERMGRRIILQSVHQSSGKSLEVEVRVVPPLDGDRLRLIRAVDSKGHSLKSRGWSGSADRLTFRFEGDEGIETIDLEMAIHPSRFVEFMAEPAFWTNPAEADVR